MIALIMALSVLVCGVFAACSSKKTDGQNSAADTTQAGLANADTEFGTEINKDGVLNDADQGIIGCGQPTFNWGFTHAFSADKKKNRCVLISFVRIGFYLAFLRHSTGAVSPVLPGTCVLFTANFFSGSFRRAIISFIVAASVFSTAFRTIISQARASSSA